MKNIKEVIDYLIDKQDNIVEVKDELQTHFTHTKYGAITPDPLTPQYQIITLKIKVK